MCFFFLNSSLNRLRKYTYLFSLFSLSTIRKSVSLGSRSFVMTISMASRTLEHSNCSINIPWINTRLCILFRKSKSYPICQGPASIIIFFLKDFWVSSTRSNHSFLRPSNKPCFSILLSVFLCPNFTYVLSFNNLFQPVARCLQSFNKCFCKE